MKQTRVFIIACCLLLCTFAAFAQNGISPREGTVTYTSSQLVYTKFEPMDGILPNDTLFLPGGEKKPAAIVQHVSSSSSASALIEGVSINIGDKLVAYIDPLRKSTNDPVVVNVEKDTLQQTEIIPVEENEVAVSESNTPAGLFRGKLSVSSYSNFSNNIVNDFSQRWRYALTLGQEHVDGSPFSFDSYIIFAYRSKDWSRVSESVNNALRIYNLYAKYETGESSYFLLGRTINPKISNAGAIDGLQYHTSFSNFYAGVVVGSRPNWADYSFNAKLFQFGGYIGMIDTAGAGYIENSLGFFNQTNDFKTDRRFIYLQHNNSAIENVNIFASSEIDLYERKSGVEKTAFSLTGLYLSLRYSPEHWLSLTGSYDARKNVIYYETFKTFADSVLEKETRQGLRFRVNLRPFDYFTLGLSYGHRFKTSDIASTNNYGIYAAYSQVPIIESGLGFSLTHLQTSYLDGTIISGKIMKDMFEGFISTVLEYRRVSYTYITNDTKLDQNILSLELSGRITKSLFLSFQFEGTYEDVHSYNRVFINLSTRF